MKFVNLIFGVPLGYIMYLSYSITQNYGMAIILFTLISKIITLPISLATQKNSIRMAKIQPKLDKIKRRYSGNKDLIAEKQIELYDNEKYSPALGCLPSLIQIPLILGLLNVIYNPLQHLLRLPQDIINTFVTGTQELFSSPNLGGAAQLRTMELLQAEPNKYLDIAQINPSFGTAFESIKNFNLKFFDINLAHTPSFSQVNILWIIPILSGISALLLCLFQNKYNILQKGQKSTSKLASSVFLVAFSTYFAFVLPTGVGLYWISGNLLAIVVMFFCEKVYSSKDIVTTVAESSTLSKEEKQLIKKEKQFAREKSKQDNKRFFKEENVELLVYSESNGFYKYLGRFVEYILGNSDIVIHYVTNDPNDSILKKDKERLKAYYIGDKTIIPFLMKLEAKIVLMTTPDLDNYHIKRSLVTKDIEYIFTDHGMTSLHLTYPRDALNHFNTIFCNGPNQIKEIKALEQEYSLKEKKTLEIGYTLLDQMLKDYDNLNIEKERKSIKNVLIAPSWQDQNILESCLDDILYQLLKKDYSVIIRPHPEYVKRFKEDLNSIIEKYKDYPKEKLYIETDFSSNLNIYKSDLVITDWSAIAQEFSYTTKRPSIFINTPMKTMNLEYEKLGLEPLDISLRSEIGVALDFEEINQINDHITKFEKNYDAYYNQIDNVMKTNIYNIGHADEVGGQYIIDCINERRNIIDIL